VAVALVVAEEVLAQRELMLQLHPLLEELEFHQAFQALQFSTQVEVETHFKVAEVQEATEAVALAVLYRA
jgi:hypothetical protein